MVWYAQLQGKKIVVFLSYSVIEGIRERQKNEVCRFSGSLYKYIPMTLDGSGFESYMERIFCKKKKIF